MASLRKELFQVPTTPVTLLGEHGHVHAEDQTGRLYRAERGWRDSNIDAISPVSLDDARGMMHDIVHGSYSDEFPNIDRIRHEFNPNLIKFEHFGAKLPQGTAAATTPEGRILVRPDSMIRGVITHEAGHYINRLGRQFTNEGENDNGETGFGHQWPFARTHLWIVHNHQSTDAARDLYEHYRRLGVRVNPRGEVGQ